MPALRRAGPEHQRAERHGSPRSRVRASTPPDRAYRSRADRDHAPAHAAPALHWGHPRATPCPPTDTPCLLRAARTTRVPPTHDHVRAMVHPTSRCRNRSPTPMSGLQVAVRGDGSRCARRYAPHRIRRHPPTRAKNPCHGCQRRRAGRTPTGRSDTDDSSRSARRASGIDSGPNTLPRTNHVKVEWPRRPIQGANTTPIETQTPSTMNPATVRDIQ